MVFGSKEELEEEISFVEKGHLFGVKRIERIRSIDSPSLKIVLLEGITIIVQLSEQGYKVTDCMEGEEEREGRGEEEEGKEERLEKVKESIKGGAFETMEALLSHLSPLYLRAFHSSLASRLLLLQQQQDEGHSLSDH